MDLHFEGADERAKTASKYLDVAGFEIYDQPSPAILESLREEAAAAGAGTLAESARFA